ncbi:DUF4157 domain-containing protein [Streptomyces sp. NPDC021622]|uniref:eCIS core domain-containing protein n=1 Tax=Streptomyces sp. NPDC021622 TaxID=3155013 RepID=UPI0033EAD2A9
MHQVLAQPGRPLGPGVRRTMERGFGAGFGSVRVHTGPLAAATASELDATAYTVGEHVVFGTGGYRPEEPAGARVLAHELTHVLQQRGSGGGAGPVRPMRVGDPSAPEERAADAGAERVLRRLSDGMTGRGLGGGDTSAGVRAGWGDPPPTSTESPAAEHHSAQQVLRRVSHGMSEPGVGGGDKSGDPRASWGEAPPTSTESPTAEHASQQMLRRLTHGTSEPGIGGGDKSVAAWANWDDTSSASAESPTAEHSAEKMLRRLSDGTSGPGVGGGGESGGGGASRGWEEVASAGAGSEVGPVVAPRPPSIGPVTGSGGVRVCARPLQIGPFGNHAYIDAPPFNYAIISPMCPQGTLDNPLTGTSGQKWDNSPDPCGKTPTCLTCEPKAGVTSVPECMAAAFRAYNNPSLYKLTGPNSNTFAGTLARACCAGMDPKPKALGTCVGWDDAPAAYRGGKKDCPPGPTC